MHDTQALNWQSLLPGAFTQGWLRQHQVGYTFLDVNTFVPVIKLQTMCVGVWVPRGWVESKKGVRGMGEERCECHELQQLRQTWRETPGPLQGFAWTG